MKQTTTRYIIIQLLEWMLLLSLPILFNGKIVDASTSSLSSLSSSSSSSSYYRSVRELDEFGNSVQLKHATEAANTQGRLVLATTCLAGGENNKKNDNDDDDVVIMVISVGNNKPLVQQVTLPSVQNTLIDSSSSTTIPTQQPVMVAMCCTGIKGDATWLISKVQEYVAQVWERYDYHLPNIAIIHLISRLLGTYAGYDMEDEWQPSVRYDTLLKQQQQQQQGDTWSRPLGIQTMILSPTTIGSDVPSILIMEPTGRVLSPISTRKSTTVTTFSSYSSKLSNNNNNNDDNKIEIAAMGKNSDSKILIEKLERLLQEFNENENKEQTTTTTTTGINSNKNNTNNLNKKYYWTMEQAKEKLIQIFLEEEKGEGASVSSSSSSNEKINFMIEIISTKEGGRDGKGKGRIERNIITYKDGKEEKEE